MSVYIKGMEMPTSCAKCKLFGEYGCAFIGAVGYALTEGRRSEDCPLVPVPKHGRLIDADALYRKMFVGPDGQIFPNNDVDNWPHTMAFKDIKHHILFAPTIIPAEEGK